MAKGQTYDSISSALYSLILYYYLKNQDCLADFKVF